MTQTPPLCTLCLKPLSDREVAMKVTAHFPCVFWSAYKADEAEEARRQRKDARHAVEDRWGSAANAPWGEGE